MAKFGPASPHTFPKRGLPLEKNRAPPPPDTNPPANHLVPPDQGNPRYRKHQRKQGGNPDQFLATRVGDRYPPCTNDEPPHSLLRAQGGGGGGWTQTEIILRRTPAPCTRVAASFIYPLFGHPYTGTPQKGTPHTRHPPQGGEPQQTFGHGGYISPLPSLQHAPGVKHSCSIFIGGGTYSCKVGVVTAVGLPAPPLPQGGVGMGIYQPYPPTPAICNSGWGDQGSGGAGVNPEDHPLKQGWGPWYCPTPPTMYLHLRCREWWRQEWQQLLPPPPQPLQ